jgi:Rps23 Pro-64 3,4-dihydroxylase Tpa1-like proline 4-hydroxylase
MTYFSTFIVGAVLLITGVVKALSSEQFLLHNYRYGLLPLQTILPAAIAFIGLESALGVALIFYEFPQWLIPGSIILLLILSALNFWSTSSGRTEDCGCYGGLLIVTAKQSLLLNLGYILLLGIAWRYPIKDHHTETWQWIVALIVLASTSTMGWLSRNKPLVDFSRLKTGNRWKRRWLKNSPHDLQQGSHFVVFFSKNCPYCKKWIPLLNITNTQKDLPQLTGIMSLSDEEIEEFKTEQRVRFPVVSMDKLLFGYMVDAFPTAILIEDGIISSKWEGQIPEEFLDRIKQYYEKALSAKTQPNGFIKPPEESIPLKLSKTTISPAHHYLQIDDFLSTEEWSRLLDYTLTQQSAFTPSTTSTNESDYRESMILDSLPEFSELMVKRILSIIPNLQRELELEPFIVSQVETELTAHNDGNYYKIHNDNGSWETTNRELTYVYYFYREPKPFSGGELVIYDTKTENNSYVKGDSFKIIEPRNNSLIVFPSRYLHEILPVRCPSQSFADSRFTINGWIRRSLFN